LYRRQQINGQKKSAEDEAEVNEIVKERQGMALFCRDSAMLRRCFL